jgi:hypothetical protein
MVSQNGHIIYDELEVGDRRLTDFLKALIYVPALSVLKNERQDVICHPMDFIQLLPGIDKRSHKCNNVGRIFMPEKS